MVFTKIMAYSQTPFTLGVHVPLGPRTPRAARRGALTVPRTACKRESATVRRKPASLSTSAITIQSYWCKTANINSIISHGLLAANIPASIWYVCGEGDCRRFQAYVENFAPFGLNRFKGIC
jgi:hypothetical protein